MIWKKLSFYVYWDFILPLLLKGLQKLSLKICGLFWDVKMEDEIFGKTQKKDTQNEHVFYTKTMKRF